MIRLETVETENYNNTTKVSTKTRKCMIAGELCTQQDFIDAIKELTLTQNYFSSLENADQQ